MATFVLEIGTEEIPSRFLVDEQKELLRLFTEAAAKAELAYGEVRVMATPRRLALLVKNVADKQLEKETVVVGPPLHAAYDKDGKPTRALSGFAASNNIGLNAIFTEKNNKGEYVACRKVEGGKTAAEVLAAICPQMIEALSFPKSMRWGENIIFYARPLRWILALLDADVVPFTVGPIKSDRYVTGHRVHGPGPFALDHADNYEQLIVEQGKVTVDRAARQQIICEVGSALAKAAGGEVIWKDTLLTEVAGLVEHPVPLLGDFDPSYLEIPEEVLLTSMETHQKSFGLRGQDGKLLPHFLTVLNITPKDAKLVKRGWERVLRARLEDARFFWREDMQSTFASWLEKLNHVIFIGPLGSMGDKSRRLEKLCRWLADNLEPDNIDAAQAARAGALAKADLVSSMVGEFDTLQGIMGGIYAARAGESQIVVQAIREQYLPAGPETPLPDSIGGAILSVADKTDTLAGCFGLNKIPTGAADPNGLRRCALGIIRILIDRNWQLDLLELFRKARNLYGDIAWKLNADEEEKKLLDFMHGRLRNYFISQGYDTLLVDAVLAAGGNNPSDAKARLDALTAFCKKPGYLHAAQTLKRVENMGKKASANAECGWDSSALTEPAEKYLSDTLGKLLPKLDIALDAGKYAEVLGSLEDLRAPVDNFFDNVLVLCENANLRENRLQMLNALRSRYARIAQFSGLQI